MAPQDVPPPPGFRILRSLGSGTTAHVFVGEDLVLGRKVALKRLPLQAGSETASRNLALHEGRAVARLRGRYIAQLYDVMASPEAIWLVEEYVRGHSLQQLFDAGTQIPRSRAQLWVGQIADGLATAHAAAIVHGDVKPANVMLDADWTVRLVDFGVAADLRDSAATPQVLQGAGTPAYMAPEQVLRRGATDRSDVYALGVVAYVLFTGRHPFQHAAGDVAAMMDAHVSAAVAHPRRVDRTVGRNVARRITAMLEKEPARRPSASEVVRRWPSIA